MVFAMTSVFSWQNSISLCPASFCTPWTNLPLTFVNKCLSSQGYGFSSGHVCMWELDYKESWVPKNKCFWTVVLEKTLESPLDCKEIQPVHPKGDQSWVFIGCWSWNSDTLATWREEVTSLKRLWCWERLRAGWDGLMNHWLNRYEFEQVPGFGDGQGRLVCCGSWGRKESDTTERLDWTKLN